MELQNYCGNLLWQSSLTLLGPGNPFSPRITVRAVEWAVQFAAYVVKWMLYEAQFHLAEGRFGKLMERAKSVISKKGGSIERRDLLRALHCDEATLKRLVKALLIAEEIEAPSIVEGKVKFYNYNSERIIDYDFYNAMIYNRPLTTDEMAYNFEIDK